MPRFDTLTIDNQDRRFYQLMGPFLANRAVVRQVGGPIWDDDGKNWTVAFDSAGEVAGFIGVTTSGRVESLYATDKKLPAMLVAAAVKDRPGRLTAVVAHDHAKAYADNGFEYIDETVNFVKLERPA